MSKKITQKKEEETTAKAHVFVDNIIDEDSVQEKVVNEVIEQDDPPKKEKKSELKKKTSKKKHVVDEVEMHTYNKEKMSEDLMDIYKNKDGSLPDMSQFQVRKHGRLIRAFMVLVTSLFFLAVVAWVGFFVFQPPASFSEDAIVLSISGDEEVQAGSKVRYRIRYRNDQERLLSQAVLQVRYPEGFIFSESSFDPSNEQHDEWILGTINQYDSGYIDIYGVMNGDVGKEQSFRVFLNYYPDNFYSEFQKVATVSVRISEAPYTMEVNYPEDVVAGMEVPIEIILKKREYIEQNTGKVQIVLQPDGVFLKTKSVPESNEFYPYRWTIPEGVDEYTLTVYGSFIQSGDGAEAVLPIMLQGLLSSDSDPFLYAEKNVTISLVTDLAISLRTAINGTMHDFSVHPGENLLASMVIRNNGEYPLEHVRVRGMYQAPSYNNRSLLDWANYEDDADGLLVGEQVNDEYRMGVMTWDERHIESLEEIAPGEEVTIDVMVPILDSQDTTLTNFSATNITYSSDIQYTENGEQKVLSASPIIMIMNSDTALDVRSEVRDDEAEFDTHEVTWVLTNTFHELKDIKLSAELFGNTTLLEGSISVPAGDAVYDMDSKKITWKVESMPNGLDVLALSFAVERHEKNPSQTFLMSKVIGSAIDVVTGEEITLVADEVLLHE
ncbi:hypothetical protein KKG22_05450 [Patescibacteria group bacterium]|nr:hypothetical protein [Patescibacteria group bacterium]MBU1721522.1 hypothetical protein [Patescibacteria group bacterium]MBU1901488.1 hypothetical protein [Patescibacteria group bacterium]